MTNDERIQVAKREVLHALVPIFGRGDFKMEVVGSTYISDTSTSDVDILVLVDKPVEELVFDGWAYGGSAGMGSDHWMSWKRMFNGVDVNMLLTHNEEYFNNWLTAAEVCRFLFLRGVPLKASTVHGVHEIVMEDATAVDELVRRDY